MTLTCRDQAALWVGESGDPIQAAVMYQSLLADMTERSHSRREEVFHTRSMVARSRTQGGDYDSPLRDWDQLISEAASIYGRLQSNSFYLRVQHAWCVGESGDAQRAVRLLQDTLADATELGDRGLFTLLYVR